MTTLEKLLSNHGPMLTGDVAKILSDELTLSPEAVRKQISRARGSVKSHSGFFVNNQSFMYLENHKHNGQYGEVLLKALETSAKRLFSIVLALRNNFGNLHFSELANFTFSPTQNLVGHKRLDTVLADLDKLDLITINILEERVYLNPKIFEKRYINSQKAKALEFTRNFILQQFIDWSRSLGFISFDRAKTNSEFAKFAWCFTAPSYVGSIGGTNFNGKPIAFVIADILIGKTVNEQDVHFFVEKVRIIKSQKNLSPIIPFLIVDRTDNATLNLLKRHGIIVGFVEKLFGKGYSELLNLLVNTIANAGAILKKNPEDFFKLMAKIDALVDGKTNNLRGDLFEMAVGYYHSNPSQNIDIGKTIRINSLPRELDVIAVYHDKVVIAECKGAKRKFTLDEVTEWANKITEVRGWLQSIENYANKRHVFELWAIGGFTDEAVAKLKHLGNAKVYDFRYFDSQDILAKAREIKDSKLLKILKEYFINEPI